MIYLSCLELDPRSPRARADLRDPYQMHRTLSRAFGEGAELQQAARCLFRAEERKQGPRVLVQSRQAPDWDYLGRERYLAEPAEQKALELAFAAGQSLRFLLLANPTRREPARGAVDPETGRPKDGPRRALVSKDPEEMDLALREWLRRKGEQGGFVPLEVAWEDRGVIRVGKPGRQPMPYAAVRFEGVLRVTDPARFREALESGIGTAKGFGFGLLSVARA